ncbi:DNA alkylation repair protein [Kaistia granuli]|uniref:DNA alkylation repair protein n=1 Tax=Kaistia granuli TaxID=363259 RepID=UPI0003689859|nr:DNA alkylation repair protein [Kaistia granuli]
MNGRRVADIKPDRLAELSSGRFETTTLTECLAVDFAVLMRAALPEMGEEAAAHMREQSGAGISRRMALAGRLIRERLAEATIEALRHHPSDTVRGWACFAIGDRAGLTLADRLDGIRPLADDVHFGVREWSWMAVRPHLTADLDEAIARLVPWTSDPSERLRRFACEAIRPRGVWCAHIGTLKQRPEQALPVLEALRSDPAAYVQDSVGNWLNDAAKDQPDWVRDLCARWSRESPTAATARICRRAQRSIGSKT